MSWNLRPEVYMRNRQAQHPSHIGEIVNKTKQKRQLESSNREKI